MVMCSVNDCDGSAQAKGFCQAHYMRLWTTGDVQADVPVRRRIIGDDDARFASYCKPDGECIVWTGGKTKGYGKFTANGRKVLAHRWAYERAFGPLPGGLDLDHLCRNPACVNVEHLEAVSHRENVIRGIGPSAAAARRTGCPQGHPYDEENTYVTPGGVRHCRECNRVKCREAYQKRKLRKAG